MGNRITNKWALCQLLYHEILKELDTDFQKLHVSYMPIKGAYLIVSGLALSLKERLMRDIDILVHDEDMNAVSEYFETHPKTEKFLSYKDAYTYTQTVFSYRFDTVAVHVEIHTHMNFPERFALPAAKLFLRGKKKNDYCFYPSAEDALLLCLCHILCHIFFEYNTTNLEEIRCLVQKTNFSWIIFWEYAHETGIEPFIYFLLVMYRKKYQQPIDNPRWYLYPFILAHLFTPKRYNALPVWARRIVFEIPFVKNPLKLFWKKIWYKRGIKTNKYHE